VHRKEPGRCPEAPPGRLVSPDPTGRPRGTDYRSARRSPLLAHGGRTWEERQSGELCLCSDEGRSGVLAAFVNWCLRHGNLGKTELCCIGCPQALAGGSGAYGGPPESGETPLPLWERLGNLIPKPWRAVPVPTAGPQKAVRRRFRSGDAYVRQQRQSPCGVVHHTVRPYFEGSGEVRLPGGASGQRPGLSGSGGPCGRTIRRTS
jgi:hypothetical protein